LIAVPRPVSDSAEGSEAYPFHYRACTRLQPTGGATMTAHDLAISYAGLEPESRRAFQIEAKLRTFAGPAPVPPPGPDVLEPLQRLLIGMSILGKQEDQIASSGFASTFKGVSINVAALESTSTALAKWWAVAIGAGGFLGGIWATWRVAVAGFWSEAQVGERMTTIAAVAAAAVAIVLAIAIIVNADVKARSIASAAQYEARAAVAGAYIASADAKPEQSLMHLAALGALQAASAHGMHVHLRSAERDIIVDDCHLSDGKLEFRDQASGQWIPLPAGGDFCLN